MHEKCFPLTVYACPCLESFLNKLCPAISNTQELSEAELWALDDKQRDEHFRLGERRRHAEFDRAKRTLTRVNLVLKEATATPSQGVMPTEAGGEATAAAVDSLSREAEVASNG